VLAIGQLCVRQKHEANASAILLCWEQAAYGAVSGVVLSSVRGRASQFCIRCGGSSRACLSASLRHLESGPVVVLRDYCIVVGLFISTDCSELPRDDLLADFAALFQGTRREEWCSLSRG